MKMMKTMLLSAGAAVMILSGVSSASATEMLPLATQRGCSACHQVDNKVVGPAYKEVAAKYKGQEGAVDMLVAKVKAGGSGVWGPVPMPPNAHVSDEDIKTVVEWIMSL
ncbi:MAG: c-type cytochrome [Candidatus Thiodiazotropha sp.]